MNVYVPNICSQGPPCLRRTQMSDPLGSELQATGSSLTWTQETNLRSCARAVYAKASPLGHSVSLTSAALERVAGLGGGRVGGETDCVQVRDEDA